MPDDLGGDKQRSPPGKGGHAPHDRREEPRDFTALYDDEPEPEQRVDRAKPKEADETKEQKPEQPEDPKEQARRRRKRWIIAGIVGAVLLIAGAGFGWYWYTTWRWLESTDDAYTQADNTVISPKISGYVSELLVTDNQKVKSGEVLLSIDPRDYQAALDQAQADVASAEADIRNIDAQLTLQQSTIDQARADVASAEANLAFSRQENERYQYLAKTIAGTVQRAQQATADVRDKAATLQHNQATLAVDQKQITVLQTQRAKSEATLQHNRATLEQARLNLGYTVITSPIDGAVGDRSVRVGQYVQPGTQLMMIVPMRNEVYVVANFKETQLEHLFRGEKVDLTVDTFSGVHLQGTVDSLAPGSGAQFALLPSENATGNFTKIVQRVPVKILVDAGSDPVLDQLRPGLSVEATVDTRTAPPNGAETLVPPPYNAQ